MEYVSTYNSSLGMINLFSNGKELTGLYFQDQKYSRIIKDEEMMKDLPIFRETSSFLDIYFSGKEPEFIPPLYFASTPFRNTVWNILLTIPYGKVITYGDISAIIEKEYGIEKMSSRAVGGAVAHNPISIIIPCHRVVGKGGKLTGYAGGLERKKALLRLEGIDM